MSDNVNIERNLHGKVYLHCLQYFCVIQGESAMVVIIISKEKIVVTINIEEQVKIGI
jgi:hypothetical protein